jgi:hypothetical protein
MNQQSMFGAALLKGADPTSPSAVLLQELRGQTANRGAIVDSATAKSAISLEGFGESQRIGVEGAITTFRGFAQQAYNAIKAKDKPALGIAQEQAAVISGIAGSAVPEYLKSARYGESALKQSEGLSNDGRELTRVIGHGMIAGAMDTRVPAFEAYDERQNRDAVGFSIAYNLQASRQGEFGEAFFPTVVVNPDQVGFTVQIRLLFAYSEVQRLATGALNAFNRKNLIRAIIDATILAVDQTKIIPVYRTGGTDSSANFVAAITPVTLTVDGAPLTTAPLKIGATFSLLGISQTTAALAAGLEDQTDAIDSSVRLQKVYLHLTKTVASVTTDEYIPFDVSQLPTSDFNAAVQGNTRKLQLNFSTQDLLVTGNMTLTDGTTSTLLAALGTNTARLKFDISGSIVQDTGDTTTMAGAVSVAAVNDNAGNALSTGSGAGATVAAVFVNAAIVGYDLLAYRTNSNRRNRGKLIDIQHVNYLYTVPLLPPISALRPVTSSDANDGNLLSDLVTATRTQTANAAVTALLNAQAMLAAYANSADVINNQPQLFGAASQLVTPAYIADAIDCATTIDSLKSQDRALDLQSLLINRIRDVSFRLYVESGYGPASEAMHEGQPPKPVVIIGTDPIIARYLTLTGDTRLVGDLFDYKIVASFDSRMAGKMLISFGQESSFNSGVPNPLHFGNMAWRPELTLVLPMVRNGAQSLELTVQPSYRHVVNLPLMASITVTNISSVIGSKVPVNMHTV